jgi:putative photosynthetic complex assembly protein
MHEPPQTLPRGPLIALAALVCATLVLVAGYRLSGTPPVAAVDGSAVATREFRFDDQPDGGIAVRDGGDGRLLDTLEPGSNGFVRGALRALVHERRRAGIGPQTPFRIVMFANGRYALEDPTLSRRLYLDAFGQTNAAAFSRLFQLAHPPMAQAAR